MKEELRQLLLKYPLARERRKRLDFIAWYLRGKGRELNAETLKMAESANRFVRMLQQEYPELRGKDYSDKQIVEETYELSIGYEPRYQENIKALKLL